MHEVNQTLKMFIFDTTELITAMWNNYSMTQNLSILAFQCNITKIFVYL